MRRRLPDFGIIALLFVLPLIMFWQQTVGGLTLLPSENLYQFEPFATYREVVRAPAVPHNHLVSDLVLQNMQWKYFIRQSIAQREIPLWNPHQFSGIPFMAAGQQSVLYPLSILYYALPLASAYGWVTVLNLWLAGGFMYALMRGLGAARIGGLIAGMTYQLCGFFIASAVFPMITGAAAWLPLLLLMAEFIIRQQPLLGRPSSVPWAVAGAAALACNIFAGHVEMTLYTLLIVAFYAGTRLVWAWWPARAQPDHIKHVAIRGAWIAAMVVLGFGLAALQFIPLFEVASANWRAERSSLATVLSYAHPPRDLIQFVMPNFYGSPAHHSYFDVFRMETLPVTVNARGETITYIDWGIKNYVEGALYLGILPLALAAYALVEAWRARRPTSNEAAPLTQPPYRFFFGLLALISLTFMFGLPTYAAIYVLPGANQLNSAFRWIYGVTVGMAVLAGFGADALWRWSALAGAQPSLALPARDGLKWARRFGYGLAGMGGVTLAALLLSRIFYDQIEPQLQRILAGMVNADAAFADARMFYSYEFKNALIFGCVTLLSGGVFLWAAYRPSRRPLWAVFAVILAASDLMAASWGFNPASDPLLLDFTPPAVQWLIDRQAEEGPFRYTTFEDPSAHLPLLQANMTMRYGLDDIRGYDSIISRQYVDFMRSVSPQTQLDFNRIAPLYADRAGDIDWQRLSLLNVRYIVTHRSVNLAEYLPPARDPRSGALLPPAQPVYEDHAVRIWLNASALPRAFVWMYLEPNRRPEIGSPGSPGFDVVLDRDTGRERVLHVNLYAEADSWLIVSETYASGWRAYVRPRGGGDESERPVEVERVLDNFQGVNLSPDVLQEAFSAVYDDLPADQQIALDSRQVTLRLVYSPVSFQVGLFGSIMSGALSVFLVGVWGWRLLVAPQTGEGRTVSRVARNSLAPIILTLFNRGIDFVFAFVMLRILGPEDAGIYYYAIIIFVWFDIFTNFGLDVFLIREVSRAREQVGYYFFNTTYMRVFLMLACVPLLLGFLLVRQAAVNPPLSQEALLAIGLLYIGLAPGSLSKGLTSLFYAFEKAEYPAAVTTITTLNKAVFGLVALLLGYGIVGLAAVSIALNLVTLGILYYGARSLLGTHPAGRPDIPLIGGMARQSWPLMLNHFLATIFFQIDVVILEAFKGARIVGQYSVAYRWLLAINIIPAFFTQALLPVLSRQSHADRTALKRTTTLALKLLAGLALPAAVAFTFTAEALTWLLGGSEYLPDGAIALQLMIWSIPIGWMNSLIQYVLIALDLQRSITRAFAAAVAFNVLTNLLLIPAYSYRAAALTTIASELVLLVLFTRLLHGSIGRLEWLEIIWRPAAAAGVMLAVLLAGWQAQPLLALLAACLLYPAILLALRPLSSQEWAVLTPILPRRLRRLVAA